VGAAATVLQEEGAEATVTTVVEAQDSAVATAAAAVLKAAAAIRRTADTVLVTGVQAAVITKPAAVVTAVVAQTAEAPAMETTDTALISRALGLLIMPRRESCFYWDMQPIC
jgi:hypothetical protein